MNPEKAKAIQSGMLKGGIWFASLILLVCALLLAIAILVA